MCLPAKKRALPSCTGCRCCDAHFLSARCTAGGSQSSRKAALVKGLVNISGSLATDVQCGTETWSRTRAG